MYNGLDAGVASRTAIYQLRIVAVAITAIGFGLTWSVFGPCRTRAWL